MSSVKNSGSSLFQMAKEHPEYVKMGFEMLANKGIKATWDTVMGNNTLGAALGYSASESMKAVNAVEITEDMTSDTVLKQALKYLF